MKFTCDLLPLVLSLLFLVALVSSDPSKDNGQSKQHSLTKASIVEDDGGSEKSSALNADADHGHQNKRGAPIIPTIVGTPQHSYINQAAVPGAAGIITTSVGNPLAYATSYGQTHHAAAAGQLVQAGTGSPQQALYHKINYVAPSSALKVATYATPVHYEYAAAAGPALSKYQYGTAIPQYQYAHYPQYQVYQHHQTPSGTIITTAAQHQPATIYAAHQPEAAAAAAATIHYALTAAHPSLIHHQQPQQQQQQANFHHSVIQTHQGQTPASTFHYQQQQHPQATLVGVQPQVPVIHQAPIAAINQVQQANQVYATQGQLAKFPLATVAPLYATPSAGNQIYHQQTNYAAYPVPLAAKQIVSTVAAPTIAPPAAHIKQLIPVTTATSTTHHGKGLSYATFTQQVNPAVLQQLQTHVPYYNTAASASNYQQHHHQQQQQQQQQTQQQAYHYQQPRYQIYSTVATPVQKSTLFYPAQYAQTSIPATIYATAASPMQQQQQQQSQHYGTHLYQQPQSYTPLAKLTYTPGAASLQKGFYPIQ
ncbi:box A-binding factor [Wyeomyia smithii]|uniref:box A-binding factor n=1 Tax=Wyeomyia smithii TaxID=174621 RepID=UPI002468032D|nr:box A-binding factor [Wyeomyia smithii]